MATPAAPIVPAMPPPMIPPSVYRPAYTTPYQRPPAPVPGGPVVQSGRAAFGVEKPSHDTMRLVVTIVSVVLGVTALALYIIYIYTVASTSVDAAIANAASATTTTTSPEKQSWGVSADQWFGLALIAFVLTLLLQTIFIGARLRK